MTNKEITSFFQRIAHLTPEQKPLFGKMNAHQMVCHCTDQIRLALGTLKAKEYGKLSPKEVFAFSNVGRTVPTPKGLGQVEGDGTKPTTFENDVVILKRHISEFSKLDSNFEFGAHPYFGMLNKEKWTSLTLYHLDHHLKQFGV
ncbi:MAG: DUF1569 domain-containing protein [Aurantibacter sp.]